MYHPLHLLLVLLGPPLYCLDLQSQVSILLLQTRQGANIKIRGYIGRTYTPDNKLHDKSQK